MPGIFVSFEGTEGSGKSTLVRSASHLLQKMGYQTLQTREPGGSPLAEKLRPILLEFSMTPMTELLLYEAARAEHLAKTIQPSLSRGEIVLCDRFTDSTLAYQAFARGLPWKEVKLLNQIATSKLTPDLTLFLDLDPEVGLRRAQDPNRFEAEGLAFQKRVRSGFLKSRAENPKRWLTLKPGDQTPDQLAEKLIKTLKTRFKTYFKGTPPLNRGRRE